MNMDFIKTNVDYPDPPEQSVKPNKNLTYISGDLLSNTRPHKEIDNIGNKTIRLGKVAPEDAVNLCYYYNATSTLDNTISIIETDTNTVTLHYVEDWIHKYNLPSNSEDFFVEYIEFEGEKGTDLEGFWGILYRDYIIWEETNILDLNPEYITVYEKYYGLSSKDVPLYKIYNTEDRTGVLDLSHTLYDELEYEKSIYENVGYDARRFEGLSKYTGMIKSTTSVYNGSAKYSGVVSKKDGMSNLDPEQSQELMMFPNERGILQTIDGETAIDDTLFYITDKFKDETPLYYKYKLKYKIYDSIGANQYGIYNTENIKIVNEANSPINEQQYKYKVYIEPTDYDNIYDAYIYTSFVPSLEMPMYVMYSGIDDESYSDASNVNPLNIKVGILEKLSVIPAYDIEDYIVTPLTDDNQKSTITIHEPFIINDNREKIKIKYIIEAENIKTPSIEADIINKKYAIYNELSMFKDDNMIISTSNENGYMTAKDILFKYASDEEKLKINNNSIFKVYVDLSASNILINKEKIILFTDPDGKGLIYAKTYSDTGMPDSSNNNIASLDDNSIYISNGSKIYKGFSVKCRNINQIIISTPKETNPLKGWYPRVRYSYFNKVYERTSGSMKLTYSVPEFDTQVFGKYGKPYIDISDEKARYIGSNTIKVKNTPMYIKLMENGNDYNIKAYKKLSDGTNKELTIKNHNFLHGIVEFENNLSENDDIYISYSYEEQYFHYKGYYNEFNKDTKMIDLNLNPICYNTYTETSDGSFSNKNSYNLFNRTVHFFLRPSKIINSETGEVHTSNEFTIYHKFDNPESLGPYDLHIGRIFIRHHASLKSTVLLDTRHRGGGLIESMTESLRRELEPDSDYYLDIGTLDGQPYQENSVIVVRLDNRILKVNGGIFTEDEIRDLINKWVSYGTYAIVEFVEIINNKDLPINNMVVNKHASNKLGYKPYFAITLDEVTVVYKMFIIGDSILGKDEL